MPKAKAAPLTGQLTVVGLGLIGASFARAAREQGLCRLVVGVDTDSSVCRAAQDMGVIDRWETGLLEGCRNADVIMLAVPVLAAGKILQQLAADPDTSKTVITDVGSVKGVFARAAEQAFGNLPPGLVPGHPIAGSERSGVTAADARLFCQHKIILTPHANTDPAALELVSELWRRIGADVEHMGIEQHDLVLAATSHLPHLLAFGLVDSLAQRDENLDIFRYAAGGFRDFTRIAASDPQMWHDIFLSNRDAVLQQLDVFNTDLQALRQAVTEGDGHFLMGVFTRARVAREHFSTILAQRAYMQTMDKELIFVAQPGGGAQGNIRVPGDKSISHRTIMLGSLAIGTTEVDGFLEGEDALATIQAFRDMGVVIEGPVEGRVVIHGVGLHGLQQPPGPIYVGNSGTTMRLLAGILAGQPFDATLTGDASLSKRPMNRIANPLREMGAVIETAEEGRPPLVIRGGQKLTGIHYDMPMASAQVKSCLLLAGLYAEGSTSVTEPAPTRDHSERMLQGFGYPVEVHESTVKIESGHELSATYIEVPGDISSAAFFMVAASITEGADVMLEHVGINPTRTGVIDILKLMGADISIERVRVVGGERVADIRVRGSQLKGIEIPPELVPLAIDEFPVLFIAAACAEGRTVLRGAEELRVKECDRIEVMADGLRTLGVQVETLPDGIIIDGGPMGGGEVWAHGDHRIAMSFSVASLRAGLPIRIHGSQHVATSFPNFLQLCARLGMRVSAEVGE
ncbi:MAG: bifunctional prephenate dehydrogenase/3-phosphoshikimate 1-carboxyvinyltransferase [Gammaproteobacteria bacterium]|jgi:3-phosphoshikimate 1-carboxyvinyltransferase|nr:bifunctional prephenate dehydrogenase/3-phosphoshikimate 1-carboxyvinyltransferase [Gammaproteobacteria bacterium]